MKVTIIGAGAMGGLFGSVITEAGLDVQLVDIWPEHVEAIKQSGLLIENEGQIRRVKLDIYIDYRDTRLADLEITKELSRKAVEEGMAVAEALGIAVEQDAAEHCWWVAEQTAKARASMGQDVDARRETEIRTINGAIVRLGHELGIDTPINFALTALIETWQHCYLNQ